MLFTTRFSDFFYLTVVQLLQIFEEARFLCFFILRTLNPERDSFELLKTCCGEEEHIVSNEILSNKVALYAQKGYLLESTSIVTVFEPSRVT